jgi:hypothetical protein
MAFHEQHERMCPACGERISATAPKCFNCGRFVKEEAKEEKAEAGKSSASHGLVVALIVILCCVTLVVYFVRRRQSQQAAEATATAPKLHQVLGQFAGRSPLNNSSPNVLADVEPQLRVGMGFRDLMQLLSQKNSGPLNSTVIGTVPLPGEDEGADDTRPQPQAYIIYLKDANLVVNTDREETIVSWKSKPVK